MVQAKWLPGGDDIADTRSVRSTVFVDELGLDDTMVQDNKDDYAWHLTVYSDAGDLAGTGRLHTNYGDYVLSRIAVLPPFRGQGYGDLIMRAMLFKAQQLGAQTLRIAALDGREGYYARYGFALIEDAMNEGSREYPAMALAAADIDLSGSCEGCAQGSKA